MELRHLRYFVAVAEEGAFSRAALRLRVAQPALSKQVHNLEKEVGVALLERLPRGVRLTPAGEVFVIEARATLERAAAAVQSARGVVERAGAHLRVSHGEMFVYEEQVGALLARFREAHPEVRLEVTGRTDVATHAALREGVVDVGLVFTAQWPLDGFEGVRLLDASASGVIVPASHALAARPTVRLADLHGLRWVGPTPGAWPGMAHHLEAALRERGLHAVAGEERPSASAYVAIAAGETWALTSKAVGEAHGVGSLAYRRLSDPPIPAWLTLVWRASAARRVAALVAVARSLGFSVADDESRRAAGRGRGRASVS